ncbi:F-box domain-containing protein [Saccharata proteae CBS 121410]|uniref:F-box domain-containing protein n=1 Tax=Saccharata proteae CBS 121410 TaxID=1314787 RepID=A0A9P4HZP7_9PEZI|nr:F-box domain-containing protein [Saccharata proteae CBS 121410]
MAPSAYPIEGYTVSEAYDSSSQRPAKKLRVGQAAADPDLDAAAEHAAIPSHPLGVKPSGNALTAEVDIKARCGHFARLPDEILMQVLEYFDASILRSLGASCKALYAFTRSEELWRALFVESQPPDFQWRGSWRSTYLSLPAGLQSHLDCSGLFSDALYRPFQCTYTPLEPYVTNIPRQNAIARLPDLSVEEFSSQWTNKPFILTSPVKEWPCFHGWSTPSLVKRYAEVAFRAEAVDWPLNKYVDYMYNNSDESPLYLFDRSFAEKMNIGVGKDVKDAAYWPPSCFGEDLFGVLGDQRPDSRWLIMGPARSGSTFHKDPNATSAWNAVLTGSKYWLMFPSSPSLPPPPGVILSEDCSEITSPLSIAEYLLTFHEMARETPGACEGICYAGEVLHVPSGWFHLVLNLEESIALTQNFVPRAKLADVLGFLRDQKDQTSGFKDGIEDPYSLFVEKLGEKHPDLLEEGLRGLERKGNGGRSGKWEELVKGGREAEGEEAGGFTFGFGCDDDEEVP